MKSDAGRVVCTLVVCMVIIAIGHAFISDDVAYLMKVCITWAIGMPFAVVGALLWIASFVVFVCVALIRRETT